MEPPKKKQKVQATLFGAVIPRIGPINKPKIYTDKEHKQASKTAKINMKANAKKLAKENAQNVRDVDESIATLNAKNFIDVKIFQIGHCTLSRLALPAEGIFLFFSYSHFLH